MITAEQKKQIENAIQAFQKEMEPYGVIVCKGYALPTLPTKGKHAVTLMTKPVPVKGSEAKVEALKTAGYAAGTFRSGRVRVFQVTKEVAV